jgi:serine/threonine protein kinase
MRSLSVPEDCPQHIADIIIACLDTNPAKRPTVKEILAVLNENKKLVVFNRNEMKGTASKSPVQETKEALEPFNAFGGI